MRFDRFSFGSIQIDGVTRDYDVVIGGGKIRKSQKEPSKQFRDLRTQKRRCSPRRPLTVGKFFSRSNNSRFDLRHELHGIIILKDWKHPCISLEVLEHTVLSSAGLNDWLDRHRRKGWDYR